MYQFLPQNAMVLSEEERKHAELPCEMASVVCAQFARATSTKVETLTLKALLGAHFNQLPPRARQEQGCSVCWVRMRAAAAAAAVAGAAHGLAWRVECERVAGGPAALAHVES
jgi:hypothetical protein